MKKRESLVVGKPHSGPGRPALAPDPHTPTKRQGCFSMQPAGATCATRRQSSGHDLLCLQSPHIVRMQGRGAQTLGRPRRSECILGASKQQVLTVEDGPRRSRPYRATHATDRAPTSAPQLDRCTARAPARRRAAQHWLAPSLSLAPEASLSCRLGGQDVKTRTPEATTRRADCGCTRA